MHARLNFIVPGTGLLGSPSLLELDFLVTSGSQAGLVRNREVSISIDFNILYIPKLKKGLSVRAAFCKIFRTIMRAGLNLHM